MGVYLAISIYVLASLIALVWPRTALLFFWPLVYLYPAWLLVMKLPLNAGFDDVFLICLFIGSLYRGGFKLQSKWPVVAAILFCVLTLLGDLSSISVSGGTDIFLVWKRGFKQLGLIFLTFSVCALLTTPKQLQKMLYSLLFGSSLAAALVILYTVRPYTYNPFQIPYWALGRDPWGVQVIGSFGKHDIAGGVLGFSVILGYFVVRSGKGATNRFLVIIVTALSFLGLMLSGSRSGWLFVMIPLMLSSLFSQKKIMGLFLLGLMAIGVFVSITRFQYLSERLYETGFQLGGGLQSATAGRFEIWKEQLAGANLRWLFFGEGFSISEYHPHSNFIGILKLMGLAGVIFWTVYYVKVMKKVIWLMRYDSAPSLSAILRGTYWAYIGYFAFFVTCTPIMWSEVRYIDFFLMTMIHLRYKQLETENYYAYDEDFYELEAEYDSSFA